jgi:hypothetical protein
MQKRLEPGPYLERLVASVRDAVLLRSTVRYCRRRVLGMMAVENGVREVEGATVIDAIGTRFCSPNSWWDSGNIPERLKAEPRTCR